MGCACTGRLLEFVVQHNIFGRMQTVHHLLDVISCLPVGTHDTAVGHIRPEHLLLLAQSEKMRSVHNIADK